MSDLDLSTWLTIREAAAKLHRHPDTIRKSTDALRAEQSPHVHVQYTRPPTSRVFRILVSPEWVRMQQERDRRQAQGTYIRRAS